MTRACAICGKQSARPLHTQRFSLPGGERFSYRVVVCEGCGFVFADDIPSPAEYERYYAGNAKYTYEGSKNVPRGLHDVHAGVFEIVDSALAASHGESRRDLSVLDVGCATGHLLAFFARAGYRRIRGVDPAPECRDIARELYGVEVETAPLSAIRLPPQDAVLLSSVLEHLPDPSSGMAQVAALTKKGGLVMVQVPDAESFGAGLREPFLELSVEHINYFTRASLRNLMGLHGFAGRKSRIDLLDNQGSVFPAITSVWERTGERGEIAPDPVGEKTVSAYIARCSGLQDSLERRIGALVDSKEELVIWGTGSLTARLLASTRLKDANIRAFVDSNTALQGKKLEGIPIAAPSSIAGAKTTVLVASYVYAEEIRRTLEKDMAYQGRIVTL